MTRPQNSNFGHQDSRQGGFTLMEMVVVLVILSMVALLVTPLLPSTAAANLKSSARTLATTVRYLSDRATTTKEVYLLHVNLSEGTIVITQRTATGDESPPTDPYLGRHILATGVTVEDVLTTRLGKVTEGEVSVAFGNSGLDDLIVFHLKGGNKKQMTVSALPSGGKVTVTEGYQETTL